MDFRRAEPSDLDALVALHRSFYEHEGYPYDEARSGRALRELAASDTYGRLIVIEREREIVGYAAITFGFSIEFGGRNAFVDELFVAEHARGKGLGTEVLAVAERVCAAAGVRAMHLEVEFTNEAAKRLYARSGYVAHTRQLMTKRL